MGVPGSDPVPSERGSQGQEFGRTYRLAERPASDSALAQAIASTVRSCIRDASGEVQLSQFYKTFVFLFAMHQPRTLSQVVQVMIGAMRTEPTLFPDPIAFARGCLTGIMGGASAAGVLADIRLSRNLQCFYDTESGCQEFLCQSACHDMYTPGGGFWMPDDEGEPPVDEFGCACFDPWFPPPPPKPLPHGPIPLRYFIPEKAVPVPVSPPPPPPREPTRSDPPRVPSPPAGWAWFCLAAVIVIAIVVTNGAAAPVALAL